ncbi:PlsC domain-containing protein [Meloidogyne graminicola]|uniref:PlsC domain-containing protein n=1 Tax=Meloidogyne graminicola TaxID=189291 RepID=A0A8T0A229_9BILA|nr:PlsC domain-containing protein [Meloidogyne graminicola]
MFLEIIRPLRGFAFIIIVFGTSIFGNYIVTLFLPLITIFNYHRQWRSLMDRAITFWMLIPLFFLHFIFRVKVKAIGDEIRLNEPSILIINHRTRLDWFYFWLVLWRMNPWLMTTNRIALKELLSYIPGAGFGMQGLLYLFLKRDFEIDKIRITKLIDYYADMDIPYQILIFPEGTDKTINTSNSSNRYADKEGLPRLKYLIYPRTAGFVHLVQKMRQRNYLISVYDITIAYPCNNIIQNETEMLFFGKISSQVHYAIRRFEQNELPKSDEDLNKWLNKLWIEKEQRNNLKVNRIWIKDNWKQIIIKIFGFCFWCSVVPIWIFHLRFIIFVQFGFIYLLINYLFIYGIYGGLDKLIICNWEKYKKRKMEKELSILFVNYYL